MKIVVIGGSGLIGKKVVGKLAARGHQVLAASPSSGVDATTGRGLSDALDGADVVVDVSNSPSFEDGPVLAFFENSGRNLARVESDCGVGHHVALSIVGAERSPDSGYMRAKIAQEAQIKSSGIPYTIVRATQFFEFLAAIAAGGGSGNELRLSNGSFQPIAAEDVADAVAEAALRPAANATVDIAGPEKLPMSTLIARYLEAIGDARQVVADPQARYFGTLLDERSLVPVGEARLGKTRLEDWIFQNRLKEQAAAKPKG